MHLPSSPTQLLVLSELLFIWAAVNYLAADPAGQRECAGITVRRFVRTLVVRGFICALLVAWLLRFSALGLLVAGGTAAASLLLRQGRILMARTKRTAAAFWDLGIGAFVAFGLALVLGSTSLAERARALRLDPLPPGRVTALVGAGALVLFVLRGGTYLVRGLLDALDTLPRATPEAPQGPLVVDTNAYNRGRVIGHLERLAFMLAVTVGAYDMLGYLVAAKGLIRIKQFEDRNFVEYFLVGTLSSVVIALICGLLLRALFTALW